MTTAAARSRAVRTLMRPATVASVATLVRAGQTRSSIRAQLDAGRWQRVGRAVVVHSGPLGRRERMSVAMFNAGPGSLLTAFTALEVLGLTGWGRAAIHVLVPARSAAPKAPATIETRRHYTAAWPALTDPSSHRLHHRGDAVVRAADDLPSVRSAVGLAAAVVTQRVATTDDIRAALTRPRRARHRGPLRTALDDIDQGAQALSEIDLVRLCRMYRLPAPVQQAVRVEPSGRRRHLDASWELADGRVVAVEVDGAYHLNEGQQERDDDRQNWLTIDGIAVLHFSARKVRDEPAAVARKIAALLRVPFRA